MQIITRFARPRRSGAGVIALFGLTAIVAGCITPGDPSQSNPARLETVTSTNLEGVVGTLVEPAPTVRAVLPDGTPARGVPVNFRIIAGAGTLSSSVIETNADGLATASWKLGTTAELSVLHASSGGLPPVVFTAATLSGPASRIISLTPARRMGIAGARSGIFPKVLVTDAFSNPVSGATVVLAVTSGGGSITGSPAMTDLNGVAQAGEWLLGLPGENTLMANVEGLRLTPVTLTVTAVQITGIYTLDSLRIGSMQGVVPASRIILGENSQFVTEVGGIVGSGQYEMADSRLVLRYSDNFLTRLFDAHFFSNNPWLEDGEAKETGKINGTSIILYRCWTEDCYESYWMYSKTG